MKIVKGTFTISLRGQRTDISEDFEYEFSDWVSDEHINERVQGYYNEWVAELNTGGYKINSII